MADEPENVDLRFLAEQGKKILAELAEARAERADIRAEQHAFASLLGEVSDAVTAIAATQERHSEILGRLAEIQANQGARLNTMMAGLPLSRSTSGLCRKFFGC